MDWLLCMANHQGWFLILGLLFSIQDYATTVASPTGQPITQIFLDTVGERGAIVLMVRSYSLSSTRYSRGIRGYEDEAVDITAAVILTGYCDRLYVSLWVCRCPHLSYLVLVD